MNCLLILYNCMLLVLAKNWWERRRPVQEWPDNSVYAGNEFDNVFWRPHSDRVPRGNSNGNPRFHADYLRKELRKIERSFWCHTYSSCSYEGYQFYGLYNETKPKQEYYMGALISLFEHVHGKKFSSAWPSDDLAIRLEKMERLETLVSHVVNSWANSFTQLMEVKLPEIHFPNDFVNIFSRIVDMQRLDDTLQRAQSVLRAWPKQFLTKNATEFLWPSESLATTPPSVVDAPPPDDDAPASDLYGRYFGYPAEIQSLYSPHRRRRTTTRTTKTAYRRERTINESTRIMTEVLAYVFDTHPKLFRDTVNFLSVKDVEFTDTSILSFKRILRDSYGKLLEENGAHHGTIIADLREDMLPKMVQLENQFKAYWGHQMEFLAHVSAASLVEEAQKDSEKFLGIYVWVRSFEQVTKAYVNLEKLNEEINRENYDVTL